MVGVGVKRNIKQKHTGIIRIYIFVYLCTSVQDNCKLLERMMYF